MSRATTPISSMEGAFRIAGYNVIVTGGNTGIGRGIAEAYAQCGANIAILCRDEDSGRSVVNELDEYGGRYICIPCDVSDYASVEFAREHVFGFFDHVDVLINNAGVSTTVPFLEDDKLAEWHRVIGTDLDGVANMIHAFVPEIAKHGTGGTIINISSAAGIHVPARSDMTAYAVAKAGVNTMSKSLAVALAEDGIRVLSVAPGPVHSNLDDELPEDTMKAFEDTLPAGRFGEPIELGAFCVYLSSPAASFIRGVNYPFDGGLLCVE